MQFPAAMALTNGVSSSYGVVPWAEDERDAEGFGLDEPARRPSE